MKIINNRLTLIYETMSRKFEINQRFVTIIDDHVTKPRLMRMSKSLSRKKQQFWSTSLSIPILY